MSSSGGCMKIELSTTTIEEEIRSSEETNNNNNNNNNNTIDYSHPAAVPDMLDSLVSDHQYGSVTNQLKQLLAWKMKMLHPYFLEFPHLATNFYKDDDNDFPNSTTRRFPQGVVINLDEDDDDDVAPNNALALVLQPPSSSFHTYPALRPSPVMQPALGLGPPQMIILDSDEEDDGNTKTVSYGFQEIVLPVNETLPLNVHKPGHITTGIKPMNNTESASRKRERIDLPPPPPPPLPPPPLAEVEVIKDKGVYLGVEDDDDNEIEDDGLGDIWMDMSMALEFSKDVSEDSSPDDMKEEDEKDCEHSFVLKDDLGYVCRVCGVIDRGIETIIEIQTLKRNRSTRTYVSESRNRDIADVGKIRLAEEGPMVTEVHAHPRHSKQMKPHQVDGFNFLKRNLLAEPPGGCILAHAPGSGKTFMIISFMQAFMSQDSKAKPLVVLPKGILSIWKKEFQIWQIEDIPLLDFYSVKADNRSQQLAVLKQWVEQKSILFLGYKQFSTIICDSDSAKSQVSAACQEILLKVPSIMILDEGHTPRNENTDVLQSLARVETKRKVVLSGTLYQNHVKEVFNVLNLVRPKFLKQDTARAIVKRIMSRVQISKKNLKTGEATFYECVEQTLQKDSDFRRKVTVIHDLREMTSQILHYYKGDFLDELPGLVDFTVVLNLGLKQKMELQKLKRERKFRVSAVGSAIYLHPRLSTLSDTQLSSAENLSAVDHKVDGLLEKSDVREGVKAKFFLNMLNLCESANEKLLVFSQYLLPLKYLERLTIKTKGWCAGREIFMISGDSTSDQREFAMERFNSSDNARVFFGSIKACGEGISLVGASRIIILDVHLNPSVTRQAIGRAFRPGQKKKVYTYRLIAADSPEEEDHSVCFRKEQISRMWFEWNEYCGYQDFQVENMDVENCGDLFLESPILREDVKSLTRRDQMQIFENGSCINLWVLIISAVFMFEFLPQLLFFLLKSSSPERFSDFVVFLRPFIPIKFGYFASGWYKSSPCGIRSGLGPSGWSFTIKILELPLAAAPIIARLMSRRAYDNIYKIGPPHSLYPDLSFQTISMEANQNYLWSISDFLFFPKAVQAKPEQTTVSVTLGVIKI
ncbi:hypothetical protein ACFE04_008721 [Oxalis oulophora]